MANDIKLYVITERLSGDIYSHLDIVEAAAAEKVYAVQIRDKTASDNELLNLVTQAINVCRPLKTKLIVNDRVGVAVKANADGVHLGMDDLNIKEARSLLGADKIIGGSAGTPQEALFGMEQGADYLGVGPVFETGSKNDAGEPIGVSGLSGLCRLSKVPVIAIGGINADNVESVIKAGVSGVAVISAVSRATDKRAAIREIKQRINEINSIEVTNA